MDSIKLGILGGGQLGRMLTMAAKRMGIPVTVLDPTPDCPAAQGKYEKYYIIYIITWKE